MAENTVDSGQSGPGGRRELEGQKPQAGPDARACRIDCGSTGAAALNQRCTCTVVDLVDLRARVASAMRAEGALDPVVHASLFSPYALFVDRSSLDTMAHMARAVFQVAQVSAYAERVLAWAPLIARRDQSPLGGVIGLDFHLTEQGPRLIEINTNPGGLLLNALALGAVEACEPGTWETWSSASAVIEAGISAWLGAARDQLGHLPERMAIVDTSPTQQFLFPEFQLYRHAFEERGVPCGILPPTSLSWNGRALHGEGGRVDFIYNRLTDFALAEPTSKALLSAFEAGAIALSPHPSEHALLADKRNLAILGDADYLRSLGIDPADAQVLCDGIPETILVTPDNRDALWTGRARYFFKPASGYGSRGSYRGDKITRRVWDTMAGTDYVAQAVAPPSLRMTAGDVPLKADLRCYATAQGAILFAARLYQGQTTNMRTPNGGFAAVLTTR